MNAYGAAACGAFGCGSAAISLAADLPRVPVMAIHLRLAFGIHESEIVLGLSALVHVDCVGVIAGWVHRGLRICNCFYIKKGNCVSWLLEMLSKILKLIL